MKTICSPCGIVDPVRPGQGITDIASAGFGGIVLDSTLSLCREGYPKRLSIRLEPMIMKAEQERLDISVATAPFYTGDFLQSLDITREEAKEQLYSLTEECIRLCGKIGCRYLVVRPLEAGTPDKDVWEVNRQYGLSLASLARENQVMLLLENQYRDLHGHLVRGLCSDGTEAADWIDRLNREVGEERFGFCVDVGTCSLCTQNLYDFITALGHRIKVVALRDCNSGRDDSLLPLTVINGHTQQTDWLNLIRGLRKISFDGILIMKLQHTAAATSPLLRPGLLVYGKIIADYFKWQIGMEHLLRKYPSRVLFGAGNMCRNYMKCYGAQYPPLFTCDNNKSLWETEFCGLTVRPPETLLELAPETAIFICNIYYREIQQQLRNMGISNPIEYFNDEYMPSFYFDRLDRENHSAL